MKIFNFFTAVLCVLLAVATLFVHADGTTSEHFACQICRDFVQRVVNENESPRKACKSKNAREDKVLNGCHFILKEHKLVAKVFDLRSQPQQQNTATKPVVSYDDALDICNEFTADKMCPHSSFTKKKTLLHADSAGLDVRVAPASIWMDPNSVRITVIEDDSSASLGGGGRAKTNYANFTYNSYFKYFATQKLIHTGVFPVPQTGDYYNISLAYQVNLPIRTVKPGQGIRAVVFGDPCFSSEYVKCDYGERWQVLSRMTQLLNTIAKQKDALHLYSIVGDNFYDPILKLAPQFFNQLNMHALGTPFITTPGNHDYAEHGACLETTGINTLGATYLQYYGQNTYASYNGGPTQPFNWTGYNAASWKPIDVSNVVSYTMVGNVGFIIYSGFNTKEETMPFFQEACQQVQSTKPAVTFVLSHWSAQNCGCQEGMAAKDLRNYLVASVPGCIENVNTILSIEGHSHDNKIVGTNASGSATSFRFGGAGMSELFSADFGPALIDTFDGAIQVYYFPIANILDNGDSQWSELMSCVESKGGLHQCKHLAKVFLNQPIL